jgi:hypothetical protein
MKSEEINKLSKNFNEMARAIGNEIEQVDLQIKKYFIELEDTPDIYQADRFLVTDDQGIQFKDLDTVATNITDNIVQNELLNFTGLQGTPDLYHNGKYLRSTNNSIEYIDATGIAQDISDEIVNVIVNNDLLAFTGLKDTPTGYSGDYFLKSTEDSIEYISLKDITKVISTEMNDEGLLTFTGLKDTPTGYSGDYFLKSTEDSIEYISSTGMAAALTEKIVDTIIEEELLWINGSIDITGAFTGLSDTPTGYKDGFFLKSSATGLEYISLSDLASNLSSEITDPVLDFTGLQDTPNTYTAGSFIQVSDNDSLEYINETDLATKIVDKIVSEELLWINGEINITGNFTGLSDTPDSYVAGSYLRSTSDGVEYVHPTGIAKDIGGEIVKVITEDQLLDFTGLSDTPQDYEDGSYLRSTADGVEYVHPTGIAKDIGGEIVKVITEDQLIDFTGLSDTPQDYEDGSYLRSTADGVEYVHPTGIAKDIGGEIVKVITEDQLLDFTGLSDTPQDYEDGSYLRSTADGVEYVHPTGIAKDIGGEIVKVITEDQLIDFTGLSDTPQDYEDGSYLRSTADGVEYVHPTGIAKDIEGEIVETIIKENLLAFTGLKDTPNEYQDGYLLKSSTTGIEYISTDELNSGLGIEEVSELPKTVEPGKVVLWECGIYVGCDGSWNKISEDNEQAIDDPNVPNCINTASELALYQEYKDNFVAENMDNAMESALTGGDNPADSIYNVCTYTDTQYQEVSLSQETAWIERTNINNQNTASRAEFETMDSGSRFHESDDTLFLRQKYNGFERCKYNSITGEVEVITTLDNFGLTDPYFYDRKSCITSHSSPDLKYIAIAISPNDASERIKIYVFEFNETTQTYEQKGGTIFLTHDNNVKHFRNIQISDDGSKLFVPVLDNGDYVKMKIFQFNEQLRSDAINEFESIQGAEFPISYYIPCDGSQQQGELLTVQEAIGGSTPEYYMFVINDDNRLYNFIRQYLLYPDDWDIINPQDQSRPGCYKNIEENSLTQLAFDGNGSFFNGRSVRDWGDMRNDIYSSDGNLIAADRYSYSVAKIDPKLNLVDTGTLIINIYAHVMTKPTSSQYLKIDLLDGSSQSSLGNIKDNNYQGLLSGWEVTNVIPFPFEKLIKAHWQGTYSFCYNPFSINFKEGIVVLGEHQEGTQNPDNVSPNTPESEHLNLEDQYINPGGRTWICKIDYDNNLLQPTHVTNSHFYNFSPRYDISRNGDMISWSRGWVRALSFYEPITMEQHKTRTLHNSGGTWNQYDIDGVYKSSLNNDGNFIVAEEGKTIPNQEDWWLSLGYDSADLAQQGGHYYGINPFIDLNFWDTSLQTYYFNGNNWALAFASKPYRKTIDSYDLWQLGNVAIAYLVTEEGQSQSFPKISSGGTALLLEGSIYATANGIYSPSSSAARFNNSIAFEESTYKWAIVQGETTLTLSAQVDSQCTFVEWSSTDAVINQLNNSQTTVIINQDTSITGVFDCR